MLQSTGLQRVRHDLATEQQPPKREEKCKEIRVNEEEVNGVFSLQEITQEVP